MTLNYSQKDTIDRIVEGKLYLDGNVWENISIEGLNMIKGLLLVDPMERLNVHEALNHSWMKMSSLKIVKNKFKNTAGIFGDSFVDEFKNLSIFNENSILKTFCEFDDLQEEVFHENNFDNEDNFDNNNRLKINGKTVRRIRSESI